MSSLEELFSKLDDGALWISGRWLKELGAALIRDRARLFQGCGTEYATAAGRFFYIAPGAAGATAETREPFHGYRSSYTGTGTAPADQAFRVVVGKGMVNTKVPTNIAQELVMPANATTYVYVAGSFDAAGTLLSCELRQAAEVPADPEGALDVAPAESYRGIFSVTTDGDGITAIEQLRLDSMDVHAVVRSYSCDGTVMEYAWS